MLNGVGLPLTEALGTACARKKTFISFFLREVTRFPYIYFNMYFILDLSVKLMAFDIYFALLTHVDILHVGVACGEVQAIGILCQ